MRLWTRGLGVAGAACALALALAACGGSSSSSSGASGGSSSSTTLKPAQTGAGQQLTNGTKGGTLNVLQHLDYQHLDPGQAYYALDYDIIYVTQSPLFMFPPNDPTRAIPLLAAGPAKISDGGKTVTVTIRQGVKYSPPVNRAVTSQDVAYAIERGANPNVANPYFPSYFDYIQGAS
jgi:peptide/nickel transport system substrate-binding protein